MRMKGQVNKMTEIEMECGECEGKEYQENICDFKDFIAEHKKCFPDGKPHFSLLIEEE